LGHPTLAVTTILGVLLIGGGLGSGFAGRWANQHRLTRLLGVILSIVILVLLWLLVWPWLSQSFQDSQTAGRVLVAAVSVLPLAVLLGIPFPLGLWFVCQIEPGDRHVALGWAVNGVMTVVGSATAIAVAMLSGFSRVLLVGALAYTIAIIFVYLAARRSNLKFPEASG
jgi:site-specific recombinase